MRKSRNKESVSATQLADLLKPRRAKVGSGVMKQLGIREHEVFHKSELLRRHNSR